MKSDKTFEVMAKKFKEGIEELGFFEDERMMEVCLRITCACARLLGIKPEDFGKAAENELRQYYAEEKVDFVAGVKEAS